MLQHQPSCSFPWKLLQLMLLPPLPLQLLLLLLLLPHKPLFCRSQILEWCPPNNFLRKLIWSPLASTRRQSKLKTYPTQATADGYILV